MQVLNGRYGAYISFNKQNYKIPANYVAQELTLEQCREIVGNEDNASKKSARGKASKGAAKTTAKKAAAKKTAKAK